MAYRVFLMDGDVVEGFDDDPLPVVGAGGELVGEQYMATVTYAPHAWRCVVQQQPGR